jgi:2,4-dienoyl-CoA reductase-like NADH-dependent reductase (Old Yellow Enzyme family)
MACTVAANNLIGFVTEPVQAEQIIATGRADAILMAREFSRQPY